MTSTPKLFVVQPYSYVCAKKQRLVQFSADLNTEC